MLEKETKKVRFRLDIVDHLETRVLVGKIILN